MLGASLMITPVHTISIQVSINGSLLQNQLAISCIKSTFYWYCSFLIFDRISVFLVQNLLYCLSQLASQELFSSHPPLIFILLSILCVPSFSYILISVSSLTSFSLTHPLPSSKFHWEGYLETSTVLIHQVLMSL